jgi:hypothetical protein
VWCSTWLFLSSGPNSDQLQTILLGELCVLDNQALKTLGHCAKRSRQLTDNGREERKIKNAQALCLQGNLSMACKTIVQKGLAAEEKLQVLPYKHPCTPTMILQDQDLLQEIQHLQDKIDLDELVPPSTLHIR